MDMDALITEVSNGNVSLVLLTHINNVIVTCEPPSCSVPQPWKLDETACEMEGNEYGCRSVIENESNLAKFSDDTLQSNNQQNADALLHINRFYYDGTRVRMASSLENET